MAKMTTSSKKPVFLPLLAFITTCLVILHKVNSQEPVSFSYSRFDKDDAQDLILQGDASIIESSGILRLTRVDSGGNPLKSSVGRVLHSTPVQLRDENGRVAGFTTSFVFRITSPQNAETPADGLAFFMAPPDSTIPPGSAGALLGLFSNPNALNNSRKEMVGFKGASSEVVAIEFDTYPNLNIGDPDYRHVGVDVHSIRSRITEKWDWVSGDPVAVTINYDPYGKELMVIATQYSGPRVELAYNVDLAAELPETVRVGFSGSTGQLSQINDLLSWSFYSNLQTNYFAEKRGHIATVV